LWKPAGLPTYKASTRQQCELALKNYLIPQFGHQKFREITKAEAQAFVGKIVPAKNLIGVVIVELAGSGC
jgi:Phage integrase, N-terminal SAM-like domain